MASRSAFALLVVIGLLLPLLSLAAVYVPRARKRSTSGIEQLIDNILSVEHSLVGPRQIAPSSTIDLWERLGGLTGLEALGSNCDLMIEIACELQRSYPEAVVIAEELRLSAREIKWHISRLQGAQVTGHLKSAFPDYAERALEVYGQMRQTLTALCASHGLPEFAAFGEIA